jgi:hypothetical protein
MDRYLYQSSGKLFGPQLDVIHVRVTQDRAFLGGQAVTVARGELLVGEEKS